MKSFFVFGLLFCSVGLFAQNGRILVANHSFSKQERVELQYMIFGKQDTIRNEKKS